MTGFVVDSSVVAKWLLPEPESDRAHQLMARAATTGERLIVLDLVFPEVANALWKRHRQKLLNLDEAKQLLDALVRLPVRVEPAARMLPRAFDIAAKYDRAVYDALFVALTQDLNLRGVTADEPLYNTTHSDFPQVFLLRHWSV